MKRGKKTLNKQHKQRNFVAKHMRTFNKSSIQKDKKKEGKKNGYGEEEQIEYIEDTE